MVMEVVGSAAAVVNIDYLIVIGCCKETIFAVLTITVFF